MVKKIVLAFDFRYALDEKGGFKPAVIKYSESYEKNLDRIKQLLSVKTIEEILKILSIFPDINFKEIEGLIGISHPAMWEHIDHLEKLNLVKKEKKKLAGERKELKIDLDQNIEIVQLAIFEYSKTLEKKEDGSKIVDSISSSNPKVLRKIGLPGKQIMTNKNIPKIIEEYRKKIENRLKASHIPKSQKNKEKTIKKE